MTKDEVLALSVRTRLEAVRAARDIVTAARTPDATRRMNLGFAAYL